MPVLQAEVLPAVRTLDLDDFLDLAALRRTPIREDFGVRLPKVRLALVVYVPAHRDVRGISALRRNRRVAQRTHRDLSVLFVGARAAVTGVRDVLCAEDGQAGVALERQEIQPVAPAVRAVFAQVGELHFFAKGG